MVLFEFRFRWLQKLFDAILHRFHVYISPLWLSLGWFSEAIREGAMLPGMLLVMGFGQFLTVSFVRVIIVHFDLMVHVPESVLYSSDIFAQYLILVVRIIPSLLQYVNLVLHGLHPLASLFPPGPVNLLLASAFLSPLLEPPDFLTNYDQGRLILVSDKLR